MKSLFRRLFTAPRWVSFPLVIGGLVVAVANCYPGGLSAAYADLRDANRLRADLTECESSDRRLSGRMTRVQERLEYKEELVSALIGGRATFAEVTDQFADMNGGDEASLSLLRLRYGNVNERELAARSVLDYLRLRAAPDGGSSVVMSRAHADYRQLFGHPAPKV